MRDDTRIEEVILWRWSRLMSLKTAKMKLQKYMQFQGKSGEIYKTVVKVWMLHCSFKL